MDIRVEVAEVRAGSAQWQTLAADTAALRGAVELAVGSAVVSAGHPLVADQLDRVWARWGSALAARVADLDVVETVLRGAADAYGDVDCAAARSFR